jgi:predicted ATP-binding protein involved in virulence
MLHEANPELSEQQRALARVWRERLEGAEHRFSEPLEVAFLSQVGRGKSTLISVATGLHLNIEGNPQDWSVLPVGDGRTTLGETRVHLEDRTDIALFVEPWPIDDLEREVKYLAEDTWEAVHQKSAGTRGPIEVAGEELHDLLRAWLAPQADDRRIALRKRVAESENLEALGKALVDELDLPRRSQAFRETFPNTSEGLRLLQERLRGLMGGELAEAPAPLVTHIYVPERPELERIATVVDTQGLESNGTRLLIDARSDLQRLLADPNALLIVCSEFEAAPDDVTLRLLEAIASGSGEDFPHNKISRILIVDRRPSSNTPGAIDRAEKARHAKLEQCRDKIRRAGIAAKISDAHVVAIDARREHEGLRALLIGMVAEAMDGRIREWQQALNDAEGGIQPLGEDEHAARLRELDLKIWSVWDQTLAETGERQPNPLRRLGEQIREGEPWVRHWSHLHAAMRRRGRYHQLDMVELSSRSATFVQMTAPRKAIVALRKIVEESQLETLNAAEQAHVQLRVDRLASAYSKHFLALHAGWRAVISNYFASRHTNSLWADCINRWGQGPGYVNYIADRFVEEGMRTRLGVALSNAPAAIEEQLPERPSRLWLGQVELLNFRGVEEGKVQLGHCSVLAGDNGLGKTAWLEAIAAGIGVILPCLGAGPAPIVSEADVRQVIRELGEVPDRQPQLPMRITLAGELQGRRLRWDRSVQELPTESVVEGAGAVHQVLQTLAEDLRQHRSWPLPVLCYYGTQRLWPGDLEAEKERVEVGTRLDGYRDCLKAASTHRQMLNWMRKFTTVELQRKKPVVQLRAIERAVVTCVSGAANFRYDLAMETLLLIMRDGTVFPFGMLSDGYRNIVAMVADIAWRASVLNPQLLDKAPDLVEGIVLIDEIDLHLHPRWQRHVLADLQRAFPRIQFICTTHSPFIIQSLEAGQLINLDPEVDDRIPYADESPEDIAEQIMGIEVPQRSWRRKRATEVAMQYYKLLDQVPAADEVVLNRLRIELDVLLAPYREDAAFVALLERKRLVAEADRE